jgi:heptaprenyl diphosphate synthase
VADSEYQQSERSGERTGPVTLTSIYQPVRSEMVLVEERLDRVIAGASPEMARPLRHALKAGGKRIRPALTLLSGNCCRGDVELLVPMAAAIELLHTATLLHDDTIDNAYLRRGNLTANQRWGESNAVLLGDYLCAASARLVRPS